MLLSIRVHLAGSKFAITPAKNVGFKKFLYALTALELGFMMISLFHPSQKLAVCSISKSIDILAY